MAEKVREILTDVSIYVKGLDSEARKRYFLKLMFDKGLKTIPDPYKLADLIGCVTSQECVNESYRAVIRKHTQSFFLLSAYAFNVKSFHKYLLNCILKKIIPLYLDKIKFM